MSKFEEDRCYHQLRGRVSGFINERVGNAEDIIAAIEEAFEDGEINGVAYGNLMDMMEEWTY